MKESPSIWNRLRVLFGGKRPSPAAPAQVQPTPPVAPTLQQVTPPPSPVAAHAAPEKIIAPAQEKPLTISSHLTTIDAPKVDLVLGLDLGTSCSKVVIGDPGWKNKSYAVSFSPADGNISAWLKPTRFGSEANLKMRLMNDPASDQIRDYVACYLAEVIRHSRSWFDANAPMDYRRREIRWSLNLGFPDKTVKGSRFASAYTDVANLAVALASRPEISSPETAGRIRRQELDVEPFIPPSRVKLYPEIAAKLAGYVNSPYRKAGNLLLIDVGAGTLDVSTIILHGNRDQDIVSFHFCDVQDLGVLRLYERRMKELENISNGCTKFAIEHFQDGSRPIPENVTDLVHRSNPSVEKAFNQVSQLFSKEILDVAHGCLGRFRKSQRDANSNRNYDPWGNSLRFFLTGGGCRSSFYKWYLADGPLEKRLLNITRWHPEENRRRTQNEGLLLESLPAPDNLQNFTKFIRSDFDRLSVAYGLAFGGENLMKITSATHQ